MSSIVIKEEFWYALIASATSWGFFLAGFLVKRNGRAYPAVLLDTGYSSIISNPDNGGLFDDYLVSGYYLVLLPEGERKMKENGSTFMTRMEKPGKATTVYITSKGKLYSKRWIREQRKLGFIILLLAVFLFCDLFYHIR